MMSRRKDARWQLAFDMAEAANIEWNQLPYHTTTALLQAAEDILRVKDSEDEVDELARRWNE